MTSSHIFPEVLIGVGTGSLLAGVVAAVVGTHKSEPAIADISQREEHKKTDYIKETWQNYVPAAIFVITGCSFITAGCVKNVKMRNALVAAATASEQAYSVYRSKTLEKVGEEVEKDIHDEADKESKKPVKKDDILQQPGTDGEQPVLFKEVVTGQTFYTTRTDLERCANWFNQNMIEGTGYGSFADWVELLRSRGCKIEAPGIGEEVGWNIHTEANLVELDIYPDETNDGSMPCLALDYYRKPIRTFDEYM